MLRQGVEKVMGKMHFYVCLRVEKSNETCLGLTSGLLLWLGLAWLGLLCAGSCWRIADACLPYCRALCLIFLVAVVFVSRGDCPPFLISTKETRRKVIVTEPHQTFIIQSN